MAKLVIVESPAKAKTIGKYLGDDYEVTASMGHIRDLPASQLGIDVEHGYAPQYISIKGKEKLIKELKSKAKHADGVLLATDPDREGEAISWHLANILGLDPHEPNRVTFDEITKKGVKEGMAHPRAIDEDLFNAQHRVCNGVFRMRVLLLRLVDTFIVLPICRVLLSRLMLLQKTSLVVLFGH